MFNVFLSIFHLDEYAEYSINIRFTTPIVILV